MSLHLSGSCREFAHKLNVPDYFFQSQFYLAVGDSGQADFWPTDFVEVQVITQRLLVLYASLSQPGWTVTDFLTGGAVASGRTKAAAWRVATTRLSSANPAVFTQQIPINTRLFRQAFDSLTTLVSQASSQTELSGYSSATRAIMEKVLVIHQGQLPLLPTSTR